MWLYLHNVILRLALFFAVFLLLVIFQELYSDLNNVVLYYWIYQQPQLLEIKSRSQSQLNLLKVIWLENRVM